MGLIVDNFTGGGGASTRAGERCPRGQERDESMTYQEFLEQKIKVASLNGLECKADEISIILKPHQRDIVQWAVRGGQRAIFAQFGLGKSLIQLEIMRLIHHKTGGKTLIVCPLGVRQEFMRDSRMLGMSPKFVRRPEEMDDSAHYITNYESVRDGKLPVDVFTAVSLDEASILRSYGSKTYQEFLQMFPSVPYKFVATATPSPNRYKELIHYAGFLGVMDTGQALAQPLSSPVLTPDGWRQMRDIKPGCEVIAANGKPTKVLAINPRGREKVYRVTFSDGTCTRCTEDHLWLTQTQYERNNTKRYLKRNLDADDSKYWTVKSTGEIMKTLKCPSTGANNHMIPMVEPVQFTPRKTQIDAWLMGYLLGNGYIRETSVYFATGDEWAASEIERLVWPLGLHVAKSQRLRYDGQPCYDYWISGGQAGKRGRGHESNAVLKAMREYGLIGKRAWEKSIPDDYLLNDVQTRIALLQGLLDSDGCCGEDGTVRFSSCSKRLAEQVAFIAQSLGGTTYMRECVGRKPNGGVGRLQYRVTLRLPNQIMPFRMPRKAKRVIERVKYPPKRYIVAVTPDGEENVQCIYVEDAKHLYVTDSFILTHNTRFFKRDSQKANHLELHPHKETEFWLWMHSWAIFLQKPSELGYSDEGYDLPDLEVFYHEVNTSDSKQVDRDGQIHLFHEAVLDLKSAAREKRESIETRIKKMSEILYADPDTHYIIWHDLEEERRAIEKAVPGVASVYGSLDLDIREQRVIDFSEGRCQYFASKPEISGSGCNFQYHCHKMIFLGIGYSFNDFIQSIHRVYRYLQDKTCEVHIIYTEAEREVLRVLERKWKEHKKMMEHMSKIVSEHGLNKLSTDELKRSIGVERQVVRGELYEVVHNDCVDEAKRKEDESIDLIVTSIPFSNHYEYTPSYNDFGHTDNNRHFWAQMDFLTPELLRILRPGRLACIHVKDRILFGNVTGAGVPTVSPFHAEGIFHYLSHGFDYMGMVTVVTDVVRENNQTYRLGWSEQCKDGTKMGVGSPEYVLLFRKPQSDRTRGYADIPVEKDKTNYTRARWQIDAHAFWRSSGDRLLSSEELEGYGPDEMGKQFREVSRSAIYDYAQHVAIGESLERKGKLPGTFMAIAPGSHAENVWDDVNRMRTLNTDQIQKGREAHICPIQFDIVDRLINRYSNKGELVYDPFAGLMTVPYRAILLGRRGGGSELSEDYFRDGLRYLDMAEHNILAPTLFGAEGLVGKEASA